VLIGLGAVFGLALLVVGGSYAWTRMDAAGHEFSVAGAPTTDVAMVLGAGLRPDGTPSEYLRYRLDDAAALYAAGKVKVLLVSGDNRTTGYDEPTAMMSYLVAHGVPAEKVVRDFAGQDTYDSCVRAKQIFGVTRAIVVTLQFHLARAVFLCRQVGIDTDGVADEHPLVGPGPTIREVPAAVKAAWDAVWQPDPRHLGPAETGVQTALAGT
jgi:vancomycin permeability regulator SanA